MPRRTSLVSRAGELSAAGKTGEEIAAELGVSPSHWQRNNPDQDHRTITVGRRGV